MKNVMSSHFVTAISKATKNCYSRTSKLMNNLKEELLHLFDSGWRGTSSNGPEHHVP